MAKRFNRNLPTFATRPPYGAVALSMMRPVATFLGISHLAWAATTVGPHPLAAGGPLRELWERGGLFF